MLQVDIYIRAIVGEGVFVKTLDWQLSYSMSYIYIIHIHNIMNNKTCMACVLCRSSVFDSCQFLARLCIRPCMILYKGSTVMNHALPSCKSKSYTSRGGWAELGIEGYGGTGACMRGM